MIKTEFKQIQCPDDRGCICSPERRWIIYTKELIEYFDKCKNYQDQAIAVQILIKELKKQIKGD